jgi:hypothetical protein
MYSSMAAKPACASIVPVILPYGREIVVQIQSFAANRAGPKDEPMAQAAAYRDIDSPRRLFIAQTA